MDTGSRLAGAASLGRRQCRLGRLIRLQTPDRITALAGGLQPIEIVLPELVLIGPQPVEIIPGKDAGGMTVRKMGLDRVMTYLLERVEIDVSLADLQDFLTGPVTAHLS